MNEFVVLCRVFFSSFKTFLLLFDARDSMSFRIHLYIFNKISAFRAITGPSIIMLPHLWISGAHVLINEKNHWVMGKNDTKGR